MEQLLSFKEYNQVPNMCDIKSPLNETSIRRKKSNKIDQFNEIKSGDLHKSEENQSMLENLKRTCSCSSSDSNRLTGIQLSFSAQLYNRRWSTKFYSLIVHLTHTLGHSNLIYFPYLCAKHGGGTFLIPYLISYICVGIPLLYAEMILAQFSSLPASEIFRRMSPPLAGISVAMIAVTVYRSVYFSSIISQLLYSGVITMQGFWSGEMPGGSCSNSEYNSEFCFQNGIEELCNTNSLHPDKRLICTKFWTGLQQRDRVWTPPHTDYMIGSVFKPIFTLDQLQFPSTVLMGILLCVWLVASFCALRDVRNVNKAFVFLKFLSILIVVINLIISWLSQKQGDGGLEYFFVPDFEDLKDLEIWSNAISHVLFSLNLGDGTVHKLASFNNFNESILYKAILISVVDILFSFAAGFMFFLSVGRVSANIYSVQDWESSYRIEQILYNGFTLTLTAFPDQVLLSFGQVWSTVVSSAHYFNLAKSGLGNLVLYIEVIIEAVSDATSRCFILKNQEKCRRIILTFFVSIVGFFLSIIFVGPSGIYLTKLLDEYTAVALLGICLAEIIVIVYSYGFRKFLANAKTMVSTEITKFLITSFGVFYYVITPCFLIMAIILKVFFDEKAIIYNYIYSDNLVIFGWLITLTCILPIFATINYHVLKIGIDSVFWSMLFEPTYLWGPARAQDRERNIRNERIARK